MTPFNNSIKEQLKAERVTVTMMRDLMLEGVEQTSLENAKFVTMEARLFYKNIAFKLQAFTATATGRELTAEEVTAVVYQGEDKTCYAVSSYAEKDISALGQPVELNELAEKLFSPIVEAAVTEMTYVTTDKQLYQALCVVAKAKDGSVVGLRVSYRPE